MTSQQPQLESHGEDHEPHYRDVLSVERRFELSKPYIVTVCLDGGMATDWSTHRTGEEAPRFPPANRSFDRIIAHDVLEHVLDEEAWIAALADLLAPGGKISIRVPLEGPLAWLDARNIYRYVTDLAGRGTAPGETLPTGWRRHYRERDLDRMLRRAGLAIVARQREGIPGLDIPHLAGLVAGDLVLKRPGTEARLIGFRDRWDRGPLRGRAGALSTHVRIEATKRVDQSLSSNDAGARVDTSIRWICSSIRCP